MFFFPRILGILLQVFFVDSLAFESEAVTLVGGCLLPQRVLIFWNCRITRRNRYSAKNSVMPLLQGLGSSFRDFPDVQPKHGCYCKCEDYFILLIPLLLAANLFLYPKILASERVYKTIDWPPSPLFFWISWSARPR